MRAEPVLRAITFRQAEVDIHGLLSLFERFERLELIEHFDRSKQVKQLEPPSFDGALQTPSPPDPISFYSQSDPIPSRSNRSSRFEQTINLCLNLKLA